MKDNVNTVQYNVTKKKREWKETFRAGGKINNLHLGKGNSEKTRLGPTWKKHSCVRKRKKITNMTQGKPHHDSMHQSAKKATATGITAPTSLTAFIATWRSGVTANEKEKPTTEKTKNRSSIQNPGTKWKHMKSRCCPRETNVEREYHGRRKAWGVNTFLKCRPRRWYRCFRALLK